ncbi:MAG: DNA ligase (ATP) [Rhodospirillaceae bacterium]|nr:MAG: DNA ligase (ATP) [Rhodospirillaceae bacterium]
MEARQVDVLPEGKGWQFEPKWDGFRCLARRNGDEIELLGRSGKSLARYFPEMIAALSRLKHEQFVLDGELVIPVGKSLSFGAADAAASGGQPHPAPRRRDAVAADRLRSP